MNCKNVRKNLSAYVDEELSQELMNNIGRHIEHCPECRSEFEDLIILTNMFKETERLDAGKEIKNRILNAINSQYEKTDNGVFYRYALALTSVLILIFGISASIVLNDMADRYNTEILLRDNYAFTSFDPMPETSLGGAYLSIVRNEHE